MRDAIPLVDLKQGYVAYQAEIDEAVQRVLNSGWYILGREVTSFEESFAHWCGAAHCVGVGNGTDALAIALRALGVGAGDAVFTVSHTAVATVAAIELAGATPVLVDVEPDSYTMDPARLEEAVTAFARSGAVGRPKAVIAVHLYGQACDLQRLHSICRAHDLELVEDCAQAHGTMLDGRHVGNFGDVATFSFYPTKNLAAFGDGGAIVTQDAALAERCRALRQYGWHRHYESDVVGMNSRLDELHAAILSVKLRHLDEELAARRRIAGQYSGALAGTVSVPQVRPGSEHSWHLYVIRTRARDDLAASLKSEGIATNIHYPVPVHRQKAYADRIPLGPGGLPVTENICTEILSLPLHPFMTEDSGRAVIEAVKRSARPLAAG